MGPTALHMAAKCGSLGSLTCLLALRADVTKVDERGWTAIHFAAFYDNVSCIRALYRKDPRFLELETSAQYNSTPLLLASMAGAFDSLQYLLSLGANLTKLDSENNNIIHLAALYSHTEILKYIIEQNIPELPVWELLTEMMKSKEYRKQEMGVRSLEVLCVTDKQYWKAIHSAGSIPALVDLLHSKYETLQCIAAAVLCNLSTYPEVCQSIMDYNIIPVLIELLHSKQPELQSRCSVILYDIALIDDNASLIASLNICSRAASALALFAINNPKLLDLIRACGGVQMLVFQKLLQSSEELDQVNAAFQMIILAKVIVDMDEVTLSATGIITLVNLLKSKKASTVIVVGRLLSSLTQIREGISDAIITMGAVEVLCTHLYAEREQVRNSCATALGYLSFNRTGHRHLLKECRNQPELYDLLIANICKDGKISKEFTDEFEVQKLLGLPIET
ncbi:hypothetical protein chiPu_0010851 [Chiloscyllium punctatum]|uniref:Uncharacterized protein n=1 Tax=Chiloscyllium punctatum TaxID=137246 RepID=A0A401SPS8_CHIPU|nr:hypothetical protein [Chiloscyllium punctatum]